MNLLEFVKVLFPKIVTIMQTHLCITDLQMLFSRTIAKASWQENIALGESCDVTLSGKPCAAWQNLKNSCCV